MMRKPTFSLNWKRLVASAFGLVLSQLSQVSAQGSEPPPTSGNTMTIILGLMASSLIVLLVGLWVIRGIRRLWARTATDVWDDPGDNGSSERYCVQCGEPMPSGDLFCHTCGAKVMELTP